MRRSTSLCGRLRGEARSGVPSRKCCSPAWALRRSPARRASRRPFAPAQPRARCVCSSRNEEHPTEPSDLVKADERAAEEDKGFVDVGTPVVADR